MGNAIIALNNPVKFGEEISKSSDIYRLWSNVRQCLGCKGHKCTVFIRQFAPTDSAENFHFYENGLKILRQLRHPHITKYIDCAVNKHEIWLLTERIQILDLAISNLSPIEIHSGLTHILSALIFLHNKAYICHNNVCPYSIYVTSDGQWKLGGFECAQKLVNSKHWVQTDFVHSIKIAEFAPVEDKMMVSVDIPPTARDVFAFGKLIFYALPYLEKHLMTETVDCLQRVAHRLTENDAHKRGELSGLPTSYPEAFSNHLTVAVDFLQNIHAKSCAEKQDFFATIVSQLKALPEEVIGRRLVPLLLSRHILLDSVAQEKLIPIVLQPTVSNEGKDGLLCESSFQKWIIPELVKIFAVHETAVRLALLSYFHLYMRYFSRSQLEMVLYELSLGMQDKQDKIVSASLHSMAHLVEVIGGEAVTGLTRKKIFANGRPKTSEPLSIEKESTTEIFNETSSCSLEREMSTSSSSNLFGLLKDDELVFEQSQIKLQLDSFAEYGKEDWNQTWDVTEMTDIPDKTLSVDSKEETRNEFVSTIANNRCFKLECSVVGKVPEISKNITHEKELDFFADMEPVVSKAPSFNLKLEKIPSKNQNISNMAKASQRFAIADGLSNSNNVDFWDSAVIPDLDID